MQVLPDIMLTPRPYITTKKHYFYNFKRLCSNLDCLYNNDFLTFKVPPCCVFEPLNPYKEITTDSSQMNNSSFNRRFHFMQFDNQIHQHEDVTFDFPRLSGVCD